MKKKKDKKLQNDPRRKTARPTGKEMEREESRRKQTISKEESKNRRRKASTGKPYVIVSYLFLGLFLGMIGYMIYFQVYKSEDFLNSPYNKRQDKYEEHIVRGSITGFRRDGYWREQMWMKKAMKSRVYPYNNLFAQVVGYSDYGSSGLEASENYTLLSSHADILEQLQKDFSSEKNIGDNLVTSLDMRLQQAASDALGGNRGAVIVMDTETGKVLADVSKPDFNPNTIAADWEALNSEGERKPVPEPRASGPVSSGVYF